MQLLSPFEPCGLYEWYIGTHGLTINFIDHACGGLARSAVYLPDVILEQGWTQTEAIDSLIRKSGCEQPITEDLRASLEVSRFTSTRFSVPYERWAALREPPSMATHLSPSLVPPEMPRTDHLPAKRRGGPATSRAHPLRGENASGLVRTFGDRAWDG